MPITWREASDGRAAIITYTDPYTYAEWEREMSALIASTSFQRERRMLVDARFCAPVSNEFVRQIMAYGAQQIAELTGTRAALLVNDVAQYGMARMAEIIAETRNLPMTMRAFRDEADAERWLRAVDQ